MFPQNENLTAKAPIKKKVKNKNWGPIVQDNHQKTVCETKVQSFPLSLLQKQQRKYKDLSQLCTKYSFNIQAVIGSGFASTVYLGAKINTNQMVCIKTIDLLKANLSSHFIQLIHKQIECLSKFDSNYIVRLFDVYESHTFYYLVMELCPGGDLYKMLKMSPINLPTKFINCIINQVAHGLKQIHDKKIVHRDLKTENIFIFKFPQNQTEQIKVKIGDLGFCITEEELNKLEAQGIKAQDVGSPIYMSVQVCQNQKYSYSSDIYSLGIIWYELLHKKAPWQAKSQQQLLQNKLTLEVKTWREDIQPEIRSIITKCISNKAQMRPNCSQILECIQKQNKGTVQEKNDSS